jgi:hypothetical protein
MDILTKSWFHNPWLKRFSSYQYWKAGIYNKPLIQTSGQFKDPKRHSATEIGFSDHFPVYIYLIKEGNQGSFKYVSWNKQYFMIM